MGDEADADWQDGLVEWGIEDTRQQYRDILERSIRTSPFRNRKKPRRPALSSTDNSPTENKG